MTYEITNVDLIINQGGHAKPGLGSQRHYPVFLGDDKEEYISLNGQTLTKISNLDLSNSRREKVTRG